MQVVIFTLPAYGHVNPTLRTARELTDRGHNVAYYLPERFTEVVEPTGAIRQDLDDSLSLHSRMNGSSGRMQADTGSPDEEQLATLARYMTNSLDAVPDLAQEVRATAPDCLVYDPMCVWGHALSNVVDVPAVAFNTSVAMNKEVSPFGQSSGPATEQILMDAFPEPPDRYGLLGVSPPELLMPTEEINIVPIPREFQPDADAFGAEYLFVGPMIRAGVEQRDADLPLTRLAEQPSVYISLGTVTHGDEAFFEACFDAFVDTGWEVVVKAKESASRLDAESPANVHVRQRAPQLDLLERVDTFVTHGGMNSTMEALWFGTPVVVVPQGVDQHTVAECITDLGVGRALDSEALTADALRDAVETTQRESYHEAVETLRQTMQTAGGAERVADAIEAVV